MKKSNKMAKGKKTLAAPPTTATDLNLSLVEGVLVLDINPEAEWSGIQKFIDPAINDGAVSILNKNYSGVTPPVKEVALIQGSGYYRGWTSDKVTYDVHLSNVIQVL